MDTKKHWHLGKLFFLLAMGVSLSSLFLSSSRAATPSANKKRINPKADSAASSPGAIKSEEKVQPSGKATIETVRSKVEVQVGENASWKKAQSKSLLKSADKIRTGPSSLARVKLEDGTKVLILQNSTAEMENLSSVQKAIKLIRGRVRAIVTKMKGNQTFQIKTPIGVASVRGTDFEVEFTEESQEMMVDVRSGQVGVSKLGDLASEVIINPGESLRFGMTGDIGDPIKSGAVPLNREDIHREVAISSEKNQIVAMAAEELRNADYQVGKSMVDVDGTRVRIEEYIMRPASNKFKLVALNERPTRYDYFTYTGTFNTNLPDDLSVALKDVGGKLGSDSPTYWLTEYESVMSNTVDEIIDSGTGGHRVRIEVGGDGTTYSLTDPTDDTHSESKAVSELNGDVYKVYNPLKDATIDNVASEDLAKSTKFSVLDPDSGSYRNLTAGDVYWKTRFDDTQYSVNSKLYSHVTNNSGYTHLLSINDLTDVVKGPITQIMEHPSGEDKLHNRLTLTYSGDNQNDLSEIVFNTYIIDDEGNIADHSKFEGLATSAAYQDELTKWNYQQKVTSTDMRGDINLVVDPRIGTMSGLIQ